jgi:pSer/pThr/pTyr-binding forkhead associated (FHA) protein
MGVPAPGDRITPPDPLSRHSSTPAELQAVLAAERAGVPYLALRDDDGRLRLHSLTDERITIGRRGVNDVPLPWDGEVSGVHAELLCIGDEWTVSDDGISTNGTFLNERRISGQPRLRDGDRLRVGRTVIVYQGSSDEAVRETLVAASRGAGELTPQQCRVLVALCRPYHGGTGAAPASNRQIADEVFLSVDAVKANLRGLYARFDLNELPQNQKRAKLADTVMRSGLVSQRDYR